MSGRSRDYGHGDRYAPQRHQGRGEGRYSRRGRGGRFAGRSAYLLDRADTHERKREIPSWHATGAAAPTPAQMKDRWNPPTTPLEKPSPTSTPKAGQRSASSSSTATAATTTKPSVAKRSQSSVSSQSSTSSHLVTLSAVGKRIATSMAQQPITTTITAKDLFATSLKEGMDILLSITAYRASLHTGKNTERCANAWQWKTINDLLRICNDPAYANQEYAALKSNVPAMTALRISPALISHLVGSAKFQSIVSRQPPLRSELTTIMQPCLARMYPTDYMIMLEALNEVTDQTYLRLLTVPGAVHMYFAIEERSFQFSPPTLCDITRCIPLEYDEVTNMPLNPIQATTLDWTKLKQKPANKRRNAMINALDILMQDRQPDNHQGIMTHIRRLSNAHISTLLRKPHHLIRVLQDEHLIPAPCQSVPEESRASQAITTSSGSTTSHAGKSAPSPKDVMSDEMVYRFQISTHGESRHPLRPAHVIARMYLLNIMDIVTSIGHHLIVHPINEDDAPPIESASTLPVLEASWQQYLGTVRTSVRQDGLSFELIMRSRLSLPHLLRPGYIEYDDQIAEHTMFLQCTGMRVEPISQHRFGFTPVMMAINSSANDGPARVKMEIIQRTEETNYKLKYSEFDVAWHQSQAVKVPSLVLLTHPSLAAHLRTAITSLPPNAKRGLYPATYDYTFGAARVQDHPNVESHKAMLQRQQSFLIHRRFIVVEGIHADINLDSIIPPIDYEWAEGQSAPNCLSVAQLLIQHPRLFRDANGFITSPFTKVQRGLTEAKWYLQTTADNEVTAQEIAKTQLPHILRMWLNHWETANMCIKTGASPDKLYPTSHIPPPLSDQSTNSLASSQVQHQLENHQKAMQQQSDQINTLLALVQEQQTKLDTLTQLITTHSNDATSARQRTDASIAELTTQLHKTSSHSGETATTRENTTGYREHQEDSLQGSINQLQSLVGKMSETSSLTDPDKSIYVELAEKLDTYWARVMDLPTRDDVREIGEWMRVTLTCCNRIQEAMERSQAMIQEGKEELSQFHQTIRADEFEHMAQVIRSINSFLHATADGEKVHGMPIDTVRSPMHTNDLPLSSPTQRLMEFQNQLMERLDESTKELADIAREQARREAFIQRSSNQFNPVNINIPLPLPPKPTSLVPTPAQSPPSHRTSPILPVETALPASQESTTDFPATSPAIAPPFVTHHDQLSGETEERQTAPSDHKGSMASSSSVPSSTTSGDDTSRHNSSEGEHTVPTVVGSWTGDDADFQNLHARLHTTAHLDQNDLDFPLNVHPQPTSGFEARNGKLPLPQHPISSQDDQQDAHGIMRAMRGDITEKDAPLSTTDDHSSPPDQDPRIATTSIIENIDLIQLSTTSSGLTHSPRENLAPRFATFAEDADDDSSAIPPAFATLQSPTKSTSPPSTQPSPPSVMTRRQAKAANTPLHPPLTHANPRPSTKSLKHPLGNGGSKN